MVVLPSTTPNMSLQLLATIRVGGCWSSRALVSLVVSATPTWRTWESSCIKRTAGRAFQPQKLCPATSSPRISEVALQYLSSFCNAHCHILASSSPCLVRTPEHQRCASWRSTTLPLYMGKMGSICHFPRALPASIWGHCSQVLAFTSIWGTQKGV